MEDSSDSHVNSPMSTCCYSTSVPSPRRRLMCREDLTMSDTDVSSTTLSPRDVSRKRQNSFDITNGTTGCTEFGPLTKRIKF